MKVGVPKETIAGERRVGIVPEAAGELRERGLELRVETGAGRDYYVDQAYADAGAEVVEGPDRLWRESDLVAKVLPPAEGELDRLHDGLALISFLQPVARAELVRALAERGVTAFSLDAIPRIARAQGMDALSSMSSVAGYKSALIGANALGRYLPMMTTAAGTIKAGRVLVLGAGVAGLQAVATAKRLGAQVTAFDIRPEVKEQVESLGAAFLEERREGSEAPTRREPASGVPDRPTRTGVAGAIDWLRDVFELTGDGAAPGGEGTGDDATEELRGDTGDGGGAAPGGYARLQPEEKQRRDRELISKRLPETDLVITTALVPGKPAPTLLTREMVELMRPGAVVVDLAAEAGGNCELTCPGDVVEHGLVQVHGPANLPSEVPIDSSRLYSRNLVNLLSHLTAEGELRLDFEDEITDAVCLTHAGAIRSAASREALGEAARTGTPGGDTST